MKIVVLQLCRMGDIVQTVPMLHALAREGHDVDLVVRKEFASLPLPASAVRTVFALPTVDPGSDVSAALEELEALSRWLTPLRERGYDLVLNLSHDESSRWLSLALNAGEVRGVSVGRDRTVVASDPWTRYLLTIPANRGVGAFNLADVYIDLGGASFGIGTSILPVELGSRDQARGLLRARGASGGPIVGLVPGASDARKRWPAASFAAVGAALRREGVEVAVLGAPSETELVDAVVRGSGADLIGLAGETTLAQLGAVLAELDLVVTNDTGSMHLAAAVGTRTLTVTMGPAAVHESAPFGVGHVAIQPALHCHPCVFASSCFDPVCHTAVSAPRVVALVRALVHGTPLPDSDDEGARVFETAVDECGRAVAEPVRRYPARPEDIMQSVYRRFWTSTLPSQASPASPDSLSREIERRWELGPDAEARRRIASLREPLVRLAELADACATALLDGLSGSEAAAGISTAVQHIASEVSLLGELQPLLKPLTAFVTMDLQLAGSRGSERVVLDLLQSVSSTANRARLLERLLGSLEGSPEASPVMLGSGP